MSYLHLPVFWTLKDEGLRNSDMIKRTHCDTRHHHRHYFGTQYFQLKALGLPAIGWRERTTDCVTLCTSTLGIGSIGCLLSRVAMTPTPHSGQGHTALETLLILTLDIDTLTPLTHFRTMDRKCVRAFKGGNGNIFGTLSRSTKLNINELDNVEPLYLWIAGARSLCLTSQANP